MKKIIIIAVLFSIALVFCKKDNDQLISFTPTNFIISDLGSQMRLSIHVPMNGIYSFSAIPYAIDAYDDLFYNFQVPTNEMEDLANNLSDTLIFKWESMTSMSPYPENECEFLVYSNSESGNYMCSIGKGEIASNIIQELSNSVTGESKEVLLEIAGTLSQ